MTHRIYYNSTSDATDDTITVDWATVKSIGDSVKSWVDGSADRKWQGVSYDDQNGQFVLKVQVENVDDIDAMLTTIDNGIQNINTSEGTAFELASDVAKIQPMA